MTHGISSLNNFGSIGEVASFSNAFLSSSDSAEASLSMDEDAEALQGVIKVPVCLGGISEDFLSKKKERKKNDTTIDDALDLPLVSFAKVSVENRRMLLEKIDCMDAFSASVKITPLNGSWDSENSELFKSLCDEVAAVANGVLPQDLPTSTIPIQSFIHRLKTTNRLPSPVSEEASVILALQGKPFVQFFHEKKSTKKKSNQNPNPVAATQDKDKNDSVSVDISLSLLSMNDEQERFFKKLRCSCSQHKNIELMKPEDLHISLCIVEDVSRETARSIKEQVNGLFEQLNVEATPRANHPLSIMGRDKNFAVVDMEADSALKALCQKVRNVVFEISSKEDHFEFTPHVSIARSKLSGGFSEGLAGRIPENPPSFTFNRQNLFISTRTMTKKHLARMAVAP